MILIWMLLIPVAGGTAAWLASRRGETFARYIAMAAMVADLGLAAGLWIGHAGAAGLAGGGRWLESVSLPWIPQIGASFDLGLDGLSLVLISLTNFLGVVAVAASWRGVKNRVGAFHFNLLVTLAAINLVFLATDLFLFYVAWEIMLVPLYFLIALWGQERRVRAAVKFFLYTQVSGLLMLVAILGLYFVHGRSTGVYTFRYEALLATPMSASTATWLMLGFFAAFAVKLPVVPVHGWLPDAHMQAPASGGVDIAGLVVKVGAYGLIRFVVGLFPSAAHEFAPVAMTLGVIGILYGAALAFAQSDLKRLVAYTSVSHMGFVLLGVFSMNDLATQGAVVLIIASALSAAGLFAVAGQIHARTGERDLARMGGLWSVAPRLGGAGLFFALASLGLPGLASFVGEFLVLLGAYRVSVPLTAVAAGGMVLSVVYAVWMFQRVFHGPASEERKAADLDGREMAMQAALIAAVLWLGLYPRPVLQATEPAITELRKAADRAACATTAAPAPADLVEHAAPAAGGPP